MTVERFNARTWPDHVLDELFSDAFPAFITADLDAKKYIGRARAWFADLNIVLVDEHELYLGVVMLPGRGTTRRR